MLAVLGVLSLLPLPVSAAMGVPLTPAATMAALGCLLLGGVLLVAAAPRRNGGA